MSAIVLRGLNPVTVRNATIFMPLFLVHGVLLHPTHQKALENAPCAPDTYK